MSFQCKQYSLLYILLGIDLKNGFSKIFQKFFKNQKFSKNQDFQKSKIIKKSKFSKFQKIKIFQNPGHEY